MQNCCCLVFTFKSKVPAVFKTALVKARYLIRTEPVVRNFLVGLLIAAGIKYGIPINETLANILVGVVSGGVVVASRQEVTPTSKLN